MTVEFDEAVKRKYKVRDGAIDLPNSLIGYRFKFEVNGKQMWRIVKCEGRWHGYAYFGQKFNGWYATIVDYIEGENEQKED